MGRLNINLYVMLKFTERPKTPGITSKKTWLFLQVTFVLIWIKQTLIWFNLQRDGTGNGLSNTRDTFAESLQLQISVLHQSMCILHVMTRQNINKKYLMCQIPVKMVEQHAIPNSSLHNLKIYSSKRCRKTSQRWIYVASLPAM